MNITARDFIKKLEKANGDEVFDIVEKLQCGSLSVTIVDEQTNESTEPKPSDEESVKNEPVVMCLDNGTEAKYGDVIRWNCWDSDDFTTWTLTGLYTRKGVVYLGGGIDFGMGIGQVISIEEVMQDAEHNDPDDRGIKRVGSASKLGGHISNFKDT